MSIAAILVAKGYGLANLENDVRGSITEQFTAAAIMQLVERGQIALDDDPTNSIPDWPSHGQRGASRVPR